MSSRALGRNGALRKTSVLQNFAILWGCNIKNMGKKGARSLLGSSFSAVESPYFTYFTRSVTVFGNMERYLSFRHIRILFLLAPALSCLCCSWIFWRRVCEILGSLQLRSRGFELWSYSSMWCAFHVGAGVGRSVCSAGPSRLWGCGAQLACLGTGTHAGENLSGAGTGAGYAAPRRAAGTQFVERALLGIAFFSLGRASPLPCLNSPPKWLAEEGLKGMKHGEMETVYWFCYISLLIANSCRGGLGCNTCIDITGFCYVVWHIRSDVRAVRGAVPLILLRCSWWDWPWWQYLLCVLWHRFLMLCYGGFDWCVFR